MKTSKEIVLILRSIKDIKIENNELWIKFKEESTTFKDGWEPNAGFNYNSFTRLLLELIEDELQGNLE